MNIILQPLKKQWSVTQVTIFVVLFSVVLSILIAVSLFSSQTTATKVEAARNNSEWTFLYCEDYYGKWLLCYEYDPDPWDDPDSDVWCVEHGTC